MVKTTAINSSIRQQEIVDCARRIISSKGIENLTIREIANELKVTDGALYRHFKSKKEIISLLINDIERTLLTTITAAAQKSDEPAKKLENIFSSHISYSEQRKGVSFIVINETLNLKDRNLQQKMFNVIRKYLKKIRQILTEGVQAGNFRKDINLHSSSIVFFGMVQSLVTLWALSGFKYTLKKTRQIKEIFEIYKRGLFIVFCTKLFKIAIPCFLIHWKS